MRGRMSLRRRSSREDGASAVEYGLLVAGIAVLILGAVFGIGYLLVPSLAGLGQ